MVSLFFCVKIHKYYKNDEYLKLNLFNDNNIEKEVIML